MAHNSVRSEPTVKVVGTNGQISLGKKYAGQPASLPRHVLHSTCIDGKAILHYDEDIIKSTVRTP